jgi:hypothetical protein
MFTNDDGSLKDIIQFGNMTPIPASNLVWYVHEREGAAWQGKSMLRPAYGAWLLKHEMWRVLATGNRRFSMGVPNVTAPVGGTPQQVEQAALLASSMRVGDQAGIGLPDGFKLELTGITGSVPDTLAFIRYLDGCMAQMALASVLNLDASPNGSRALGATFVDLLLSSLNGIGKELAGTLTGLAVRMTDYNFGEDEPAPRIVIGDAGSRPEVTSLTISDLMKVGAVSPDPALEEWVRERWNMPEREDDPEPVPVPALPPDAIGTPPAVPPVPDVPPVPMPEPVKASRKRTRTRVGVQTGIRAATVGHRDLTMVEAVSQVNPETIDVQWTSALTALVAGWTAISAAQRADITDQIKAAVKADDMEALAAITVDIGDGTELLTDAMRAMSEDAAKEAKREAKDQGVTVTGEVIDTERLGSIAATVVAIMGSGFAGAAAREALRVWSPGSKGSDIAALVDTHLGSLSDAYLKDQLGHALSSAQNAARMAVMNAGPKADYYSSEILDEATCDPCRGMDGTKFKDADAASEAYASGGYIRCLGRERCRGIVVAVYADVTK